MVCFVMALKSKRLSNDWGRVSQLCEAALQSAYRQTEADIRIVLVCHESPDLKERYDSRLEIINVDFPPPPQDAKLTMTDKWRKVAAGMVRAGQLKPNFVMIMDADDLVSNGIATWAREHPNSNGGVIRRGYIYCPGSRWIVRENNYNCGTNAIVSARLIQFPKDTSEESFGACSVLRWGHTAIEGELAKAGTPLEVLPFRAGVYTIAHGDNHAAQWTNYGPSGYGMTLKSLIRHPLKWRLCTAGIRREFAMDYLPK